MAYPDLGRITYCLLKHTYILYKFYICISKNLPICGYFIHIIIYMCADYQLITY